MKTASAARRCSARNRPVAMLPSPVGKVAKKPAAAVMKKPSAARSSSGKRPAEKVMTKSSSAVSSYGTDKCYFQECYDYRHMVWCEMTPGERKIQGVRCIDDIHIVGVKNLKGGILFKAGGQLYGLSNGDSWHNPATFKKLKTVIRLYIHQGNTRTLHTSSLTDT